MSRYPTTSIVAATPAEINRKECFLRLQIATIVVQSYFRGSPVSRGIGDVSKCTLVGLWGMRKTCF